MGRRGLAGGKHALDALSFSLMAPDGLQQTRFKGETLGRSVAGRINVEEGVGGLERRRVSVIQDLCTSEVVGKAIMRAGDEDAYLHSLADASPSCCSRFRFFMVELGTWAIDGIVDSPSRPLTKGVSL